MRKHLIGFATVRNLAAALPILCAFGVLAAGSVARAEDGGPTSAPTRVYDRLLARFDANHDGVLETSELPGRLQKRLGRADANGDGRITPEELHAFGVARRAKRFARADKNGDGKLVPAEVGAGRWDYLKVADLDGDGAVTLDEIEQAVASGTLRRPSTEQLFDMLDRNHQGYIDLTAVRPRVRARLEPADTNHDSKVTLEELEAYRASRGRD